MAVAPPGMLSQSFGTWPFNFIKRTSFLVLSFILFSSRILSLSEPAPPGRQRHQVNYKMSDNGQCFGVKS